MATTNARKKVKRIRTVAEFDHGNVLCGPLLVLVLRCSPVVQGLESQSDQAHQSNGQSSEAENQLDACNGTGKAPGQGGFRGKG